MDELFRFLHLAERLKNELRHSWTSQGRRESVAEHTWRMSLMAIVIAPHLSLKIDLCKTLKMIIIHDLVEALVGDVPVFAYTNAQFDKEKAAIDEIKTMLQTSAGADIYHLWHEFEMRLSNEAKFAKALDKMEANMQHNEADLSTWTSFDREQVFLIDDFCLVDPFLQAMNEKIKQDAACK
jgi:putative hydrolases of HD superfamily